MKKKIVYVIRSKNEVLCAEAGSLAAEGSDYFFDLSLLMKVLSL
jgi:hypothetical protein